MSCLDALRPYRNMYIDASGLTLCQDRESLLREEIVAIRQQCRIKGAVWRLADQP